jgi:hypothetical protein
MTRNRILLLILLIALPLIFFLIRDRSFSTPLNNQQNVSQKKVDVDTLQIDGRKVIGLTPGKEKEEISKIQVANSPSPEWKPNLEKTILIQGGNSVKDLEINKVDSFVWSQDGISLFVESVIVKFKNEHNESTSFRVLVDAQTGKILQNWDRPLIDPISPSHSFKLKVDPSYDSE